MKKLIALLISALMILSMTAIAETAEDTALIARISNIALDINANGEEQAVNLDGFEAYLSLDTADGVSLIGQAFNGDDPLALAVLKVADGQVQVVIGGVDKTYVIDVEQLKGVDLNSMGQEMRAALPGLVNMQIPMIPAISLPKLSISPILGMFGTQEADGSVSFSVPSEMVDTLLDQVLEIAKGSMTSLPAQTQETVQQLLGAVEQLRASGLSFALDGSAKDDGESETITVNVYLASQGQTSEDPVAVLTFVSKQDVATLNLDVPSDSGFMTVAAVNVTTADGNLEAALDIAGMMQFSLSIFQEDTVQYISLGIGGAAMEGASMGAELSYGKIDEGDLAKLVVNGGEAFNIEATCVTESTSDVSNAGKFSLFFDAQGTSLNLTADIEEFLGSVNLGDFTMPETTAPIEELESEEGQAAVSEALAPLVEYLNSLPLDQAA